MWLSLLIAGFSSLLIAILAYWRALLNLSGVYGAVVIGTAIFGLGGWRWGMILALFFVTSSFLSRFQEKRKREVAEKFDKGHRRDWGQTMANGGTAALAAVLTTLVPAPIWLPFFIGALATVTADTWATELGTLAQRPPRLITNGRPVLPGTSGGITTLGTSVALAGGLLIGLAAGGLIPDLTLWQGGVIGGLAGLFGALFDSYLGATVQTMYFCQVCEQETEKLNHHGRPSTPLRGWSWLNNDWVNLLASLAGGTVGIGIWFLFT